MHKLLFLTLAGLGLIRPCYGVGDSVDHQVTAWTIADGLPQSSPTALAIGPRGYLWVGTELGLARFDGSSFRVWDTRHGLPGERVTRMLPTRQGLWIATEPAALSLFHEDRFDLVLPGEPIQALLEDRAGSVWIATRQGLMVARPDSPLTPEHVSGSPSEILVLMEEADGGLLAAGFTGLYRKAPGETWNELPAGPLELPISGLGRVESGLLAGARNGFWQLDAEGWTLLEQGTLVRPEVAVDAAGVGWMWSRDRGLRRFSGGSLEEVSSVMPFGRAVFSVLPDGPDTLWVGIADQGLLRLRRALFEALTVNDGLPARAVHGVLEDRDGALWLGSLEAGISRVLDGRVESFGVEQGMPDPAVMSLAESSDGQIWIGTTRGLAVWRDGGVEAILPPPPAPQEPATVVEIVPQADGSILFAQQGGVFRFGRGATEVIVPAGTVSENEFLHVDRAGVIWFGGASLCSHDGQSIQCAPRDAPAAPRIYTRCAFDAPGGEVWFCTYGAGLCGFDASGYIRCISEEQGLPHRTVHNVLVDGLGWAWLPSNRGLARVALGEIERAFADPGHTVRADTFGLADGLPDLEFNGGVPPRGVVLRDGRLALPTMGGLAIVDPRSVARATAKSPSVDFVSLAVNGVATQLRPDLELAPGTDRVELTYTAVLPRDPDKVRFRYRLEGHDEGWIAAGAGRSATYTGLAPGPYRFEVQASAGSGPWSAPADLRFRLQPFFWQTWWFAVAVASILLAIAGYVLRSRVRRAVELERLRLRIATDLHDDLGSELSGISLASALLEDGAELPDATRRTLQDIRASTAQLLPRMRDIVWLIDPQQESAGALIERLRAIAGALTAGMELRFQDLTEGRRLNLGMAHRRDLLLLYREALTNIGRHAEARRVDIQVRASPNQLDVEIRDDGKGFDTENVYEGSGLSNMRRRARALGARLELESSVGAGTTLRLTIPLTRSGRGRRRRRSPS